MVQTIMEQRGLKDFQELIGRWEALSKNMKKRPTGAPIILPDIFLVSHSGTGRTHLLNLLSDYLSQRPNLMDFYGDVKYFEFFLNYCSPKEHFSEFSRLMNEVENAAGFRNEFRGIVFIDVDEWRSHFEEKHFIRFLEYLSDNSRDWLVVLSVTDGNKEQIDGMVAIVSAFLRVERVTIEPPSREDLLYYADGVLSAYGVSLDEGARELLGESIGVLCRNKYFDGYKTLRMLCQDIAYVTFTQGTAARTGVLTAEDLKDFSQDSDTIRRTVRKIEKTRQIGFSTRGEA